MLERTDTYFNRVVRLLLFDNIKASLKVGGGTGKGGGRTGEGERWRWRWTRMEGVGESYALYIASCGLIQGN